MAAVSSAFIINVWFSYNHLTAANSSQVSMWWVVKYFHKGWYTAPQHGQSNWKHSIAIDCNVQWQYTTLYLKRVPAKELPPDEGAQEFGEAQADVRVIVGVWEGTSPHIKPGKDLADVGEIPLDIWENVVGTLEDVRWEAKLRYIYRFGYLYQ